MLIAGKTGTAPAEVLDGDDGVQEVPVTASRHRADAETVSRLQPLMTQLFADTDDQGKMADQVLDGYHGDDADNPPLTNGRDGGVEQVAAQVC